MAIVDKVLDFGNSRRGKIIGWAISVTMAVIFFVGITLTAVGSTTINIKSIVLVADGIEKMHIHAPLNEYKGYHLNVSAIDTPVTALPSPANITDPIEFKVSQGQSYIDIIHPKVGPGGTAIIRLKKINNMYEFQKPLIYDYNQTSKQPQSNMTEAWVSNTDIDKIQIDISVRGKPVEKIFVRIILRQEDVSVGAVLESNLTDDQNSWNAAEFLSMKHMINENTPKRQPDGSGNPVQYRVAITFSIFGQIIFDSTRRADCTYKEEVDNELKTFPRFDYEMQSGSYDIELFEEENDYLIFIRPRVIQENAEVLFKIWVNLNGEKYFTETYLSVNIKYENPNES
jgi:hypothetical protein